MWPGDRVRRGVEEEEEEEGGWEIVFTYSHNIRTPIASPPENRVLRPCTALETVRRRREI